MKNTEKTMEKLVALCKGRGFIFAGSEIYGGLANTWDYGPLGAELKNNIKKSFNDIFIHHTPPQNADRAMFDPKMSRFLPIYKYTL